MPVGMLALMILSTKRNDWVSQITPVSVSVMMANGPASWLSMYRVMLRMAQQYTESISRGQGGIQAP